MDCDNQLGVNWATTILGLVGLALTPSPFLFYKYGARIRSRSKFAPCAVSCSREDLVADTCSPRNRTFAIQKNLRPIRN